MKLVKQTLSFFLLLLVTAVDLSAQGYKLPAYTKFTLPDGLTVYLMEQHEVPVISVSGLIPAGAIYDGENAGLASLTATALKHGTKNFPKEKLDEELDFMGANLGTYSAKEYAGLSSKFATKDKDKMLAMIKEVLLEPVFNKDEFEKEKQRLLVNLEQQKESPRSVIGSYFEKQLYGNHVYGNIISGTVASVSKLTLDDIKDFYKKNYRPDGSAISIVGDFDTKEMKVKITALFASWKKGSGKIKNLASTPYKKPTENKVLLVNKADAKETTFYIGSPGISRNNPDYVAIDVVNTLFGGRFTSMLNDELRVNTGLTYGAGSRFNSMKYGGSFLISTFTAKETTEPAIDKALEVLDKLHTNGLDENALASAKNYVKGQFPPEYETAGELAGLLTQMFWYNFDESFINNFEKNVDGLTLAKANEIIANYFPKDKLQFVLVGKADEIRKIAAKYGKVTEVQIKEEPKKAF